MSVIALVVVALLPAALVSAASAEPQGKSAKGGTYRVGWESSFGFTNNFDPTGEYLANAFAINTNLLLRGLVGYNHLEGAKGNIVVPDLATTVPKPTNGGKRYTIKPKSGMNFGPTLTRENNA